MMDLMFIGGFLEEYVQGNLGVDDLIGVVVCYVEFYVGDQVQCWVEVVFDCWCQGDVVVGWVMFVDMFEGIVGVV